MTDPNAPGGGAQAPSLQDDREDTIHLLDYWRILVERQS